MSTARISRASAAPGVMLALLIAAGCVPDRLSGPPAGEASLAASAFSGKKFQLTNGTVCGASSPTKEFDQSLDESITGVDVTGFLPFGAQWEATAGGGNPADIGHFEFICGGFPNLYHLVSDVAGRSGDAPLCRWLGGGDVYHPGAARRQGSGQGEIRGGAVTPPNGGWSGPRSRC